MKIVDNVMSKIGALYPHGFYDSAFVIDDIRICVDTNGWILVVESEQGKNERYLYGDTIEEVVNEALKNIEEAMEKYGEQE
jgi:DNA-binding cell septation regulator SpoVG